MNFSPSCAMKPCGSPYAFFAAPVRKNAGEANKLKAVDGLLTLTASYSPCSTDSCPATLAPPPVFFAGEKGRQAEVPGRECGFGAMDGRGEDGALLAAVRRGGREV